VTTTNTGAEEAKRRAERRDREAAGPQHRETARDREHAERGDKRRQLKPGDREAVEPPGGPAHRDARDDRAGDRELQARVEGAEHNAVLQQSRRDGAGETEDRADGEIDAAAQNDERHPDRKAEIHGDLPQDVPAVVRGEEVVGEDR
jgi:hypothetical protein